MTPRAFIFAPIDKIDSYLKLGWTGGKRSPGAHGVHSVVLKWICDCEPKEPEKERAF